MSRVLLNFEQVVERYQGTWGRWQLHEHVRLGLLPHRKLPGRRGIIFYEDELEAHEDGAKLEVIHLDGGGRVVRPVQAPNGRRR